MNLLQSLNPLRRRSIAAFGLILAATLFATADGAAAQTAPGGGNTGVRERARPGYDALGVRHGAFEIFPRATFSVDHNDNLFASSANPIDDTIYTIKPQVSVQSDWSRHALSANAQFTALRHVDVTSEDSDAWSAGARGRIDVGNTVQLDLNASASSTLEERSDVAYDDIPAEPVTFLSQTAGASISQTFSRVSLTGAVDYSQITFSDTHDLNGAIIDNSDRDHVEITGTARAAYALNPSTAMFVEGGLSSSDYADDPTSDRDGAGSTVLVGFDAEITRLISGQAAIGYQKHEFDDPTLQDVSSSNYRLALQWFPTQLITVGLNGSQRVTDSPLVDTPEVLVRSLELRADYELLRNLILTAQLAGDRYDYRGADRQDDRFAAALGVNYLVNRTLGVTFRYRRQERQSRGADRGGEFTDNTFGVALVLQR